MKQEYVIKAAYYKGRIDSVEDIIREVHNYILGSEETEATLEMYREAIMNVERKIFKSIGEIKYEPTR